MVDIARFLYIYTTTRYPNSLEQSSGRLYGTLPSQFLIKIIEIWPVKAMGHFNYNSLSQPLKYDLWQLWAISFTIPYQNHWNMTDGSYGQFRIKIIKIWAMTARSQFRYNSSPKLSKCDLWLLGAISFTIPYQNHRNMTDDC